MKLSVGLTSLVGHVSTYAERFDLLELRFEPGRTALSAKALRKLRAAAPESLGFSLLVPQSVTGPLLENPAGIEPLLEAAEILRASTIVVQTGAEVGPSPRARTRLSSLVEKLSSGERRVAWEPRGPWEPEVAREMADEHGFLLVEDLSMVEQEPAPVVYTRLRLPGPGAALRASAIERLAVQIALAEEAVVIIEGRASARARSLIKRAVKDAEALLDEEDGLEEDSELDDVEGEEAFEAFDEDDASGEDDEDEPDEDEAPEPKGRR